MDDFGDLYADLERANTEIGAISLFDNSCTGGVNKSDLEHKESEDGIDKETGDGNIIAESSDSSHKESGDRIDAEDGDGNIIGQSSDSSDSEDDLHIVLNDEDCQKFRPPQSVALANGGMVAGWSDEEDEGDMMPVTGTDSPSKGQKCANQLRQPANGVVQGGAESGSVAKSGYRNWHVGSHSVGFPSNARISISGRGDWDHVMVPCSGGTASSNSGIPAAAGFSLPRYRTIFDMDIEEFEQKPWTHHGVDITDYFNFGLNDESWKSYCKQMDHLRQQARMFRFPFYDSLRLIQANRRGERFSSPREEILSGEVARRRRGERFSSILENVDKSGMGFEMPRGRAIQVEGGFSERIPSTDIRRPRLQDSDVVIQISMEDSIGNASVPCEEEEHVERGRTEGSVLKSENELRKGLSLDHDVPRFRKFANRVEHHYSPNGTIGTTVEVKDRLDCKKGDALNPSRAAASVLSDESSSCDEVLHCSSSSDLESHSKASIDGLSLTNVFGPKRKTSLSSVSGQQEPIKFDSGSYGTRTEQENSNECTHDCNLSMKNVKCRRRTRLQSRAELSVLANSEKASVPSYRECQNVSDTRGARTRKCDYGGHLSSYEETEMSRGYNSRRDAEKHDNEKPYVRNFYKKSNYDTNLSRNQDERDCLLNQRVVTRDNRIKQRECYFREMYHDDHGMRAVSCKDSNESILQYESVLKEKNSYLWRKKERKNERRQMEAVCDDMNIEERYQEEYVQEMHRRHTPYYNCEEEAYDHGFSRRVSHSAKELRSPERRYKYDSNSCFDLKRSSRHFGNDAKNWRYLDHKLLDAQTYRESPFAEERGWFDANSPTRYLPITCRSSERHVHHYSSYENILDFDIEGHIAKEQLLYLDNIVPSEKRGYNSIAKPRLSNDEIKFRHQEGDCLSSPLGSSSCGRSSRHEKSSVSQHSGSDRKITDDHLLYSSRKKTISERFSYTDSREHTGVVSHIFDRGRHVQAVVGHREAVNMHVNDWKGKFPKRSNEDMHRSEGHNGRGQDRQINKKLKVERVKDHNTKKCRGENPIPPDDEIEEGQLIEESDDQEVVPVTKDQNSDKKATYRGADPRWPNRVDEKNRPSEDVGHGNKIDGDYDSSRILATLARMEKRRERFKEPITTKPASEKIESPRPEIAVATEEVNQQRPARKRRWGGG